MLTDNKFEEMMQIYHDKNLKKGVWSILLIGGPDDDRRFFEQYFEKINEIGNQDWHIIGFCEPTNLEERDIRKIRWMKNKSSYKYARELVNALRGSGFRIPRSCFVFYNPHREHIYDNIFIYSFDYGQIFSSHYAESLFYSITRSIRNAISEDLSQKDEFSSADYDQIIDKMREASTENHLTFEANRFFNTLKSVLGRQ